ncbi:MAG TPA: HAD-IA family hydrolase [Bryobacteraceae bacterium]|nr:HAD-IA family hydrolase [Bryobacteraceae bacterium]
MLRADLLIFDLDGTLIDSKRDLADAVNATRAWMGRHRIADSQVYSYVGDGAPMLVRRALPGASEEEWDRALRYFLAYYREHMLDATTLYPGVREALDLLYAAGLPLAILTNKPVRFSERLIEGLGLGRHFFRIYGGNSFPEKKPHPMGIEKLMEESGAARERTMMVGDSAVDVRTARNAKVQACGVAWGFQPESFADAPPDFVIGEMAELAERVLKGERCCLRPDR